MKGLGWLYGTGYGFKLVGGHEHYPRLVNGGEARGRRVVQVVVVGGGRARRGMEERVKVRGTSPSQTLPTQGVLIG